MRLTGRSDLHACLLWLLSAVFCLLLLGCTGEEPIRVYSIPKYESIQVPIETGATAQSAGEGDANQAPSQRMLAAIILDGKNGWFIKADGPIDSYPSDAAEQFDMFVSKLKFENDKKPTWELSEGWTELPGRGIRAATLMMGDVEFSVIKLAVPEGNERGYLLDNVNRWRGQLSIGALNSGQLANETHKIVTADGHDATLVDFLGKGGSGSGGPPMMGMMGGAKPRPGAVAASAKPAGHSPTGPAHAGPATTGPATMGPPPSGPSSPNEFAFELPDGWTKQTPGMMQKALFVTEGSAKVSISRLGGAAGGVLPNVNRWRGQVGLESLAAEADVEAESVTVSGAESKLFRFKGTAGTSMTVAMVPHAGSVWFIKMMGDSPELESQDEALGKFLASFKVNQ